MLDTYADRIAVGATLKYLWTLDLARFQTMTIRAIDGDVEIGTVGTTFGKGGLIKLGEVLTLSHLDFTDEMKNKGETVRLYGISGAGLTTNVQLFAFVRG